MIEAIFAVLVLVLVVVVVVVLFVLVIVRSRAEQSPAPNCPPLEDVGEIKVAKAAASNPGKVSESNEVVKKTPRDRDSSGPSNDKDSSMQQSTVQYIRRRVYSVLIEAARGVWCCCNSTLFRLAL